MMFETFRTVVWHAPDDKAATLFMRLPGLGIPALEDASRTFIDEDFADALRAGDVFRYCENPYSFSYRHLVEAYTCIGEVGCSVASMKLGEAKFNSGNISNVIRLASKIQNGGVLCVDILKSAMKCGLSYVGDKVYINDAFVHDLFLTGNTGNFSCVELSDCIVQRIDVSFDVSKYCAPHFRRCVFGQIEGRSQNTDLPDGVFEDDCEFEEFVDSAGTTQDILELNLPEGKKVGLTVLRKLFVQKGRGRQSSALHRGLDSRSQRLIPDILRVIERNKFAVPVRAGQNEVWIPDRSKSGRALKMLASPTASTDPLLEEMANID